MAWICLACRCCARLRLLRTYMYLLNCVLHLRRKYCLCLLCIIHVRYSILLCLFCTFAVISMCPIVSLTASCIYLISCAVKKPRLAEILVGCNSCDFSYLGIHSVFSNAVSLVQYCFTLPSSRKFFRLILLQLLLLLTRCSLSYMFSSGIALLVSLLR